MNGSIQQELGKMKKKTMKNYEEPRNIIKKKEEEA